VRLVGTAFICIVAAFGAAFLVARAVDHQAPARAATPPVKPTPVAAVVTHTAAHKVNVELVSQFAPLKASLRPRPKPRPKHKAKPPASLTSAASVASTPSTQSTPTVPEPTPITPAHTESAPSSSSAPTQSSSAHHKKSGGSSGGSGTTTIGG
jgi:outer membrane biosynthesis protein TonB